MTLRCASGRNTLSGGRQPVAAETRCPLPPLPGYMQCSRHRAEALARVAAWIEVHGEPPPKRWTASYLVSGSSRE